MASEPSANPEESIDLSTVEAGAGQPSDSFTPYVFSRSPEWIALPVFGLMVLWLHLRRLRAVGHSEVVSPGPDVLTSSLSQFARSDEAQK